MGSDGGLPTRQTLPLGKPGLDDLDEDLGDEGLEVAAEDVEELDLGGRVPGRDSLRQDPGVKVRRLVARRPEAGLGCGGTRVDDDGGDGPQGRDQVVLREDSEDPEHHVGVLAGAEILK